VWLSLSTELHFVGSNDANESGKIYDKQVASPVMKFSTGWEMTVVRHIDTIMRVSTGIATPNPKKTSVLIRSAKGGIEFAMNTILKTFPTVIVVAHYSPM
jgi:hypothetical protein